MSVYSLSFLCMCTNCCYLYWDSASSTCNTLNIGIMFPKDSDNENENDCNTQQNFKK